MAKGRPTILDLDHTTIIPVAGTLPALRHRHIQGCLFVRALAPLASLAVFAALMLVAPAPRGPQRGSLKLWVKAFPTLAPYACQTIQIRLDTPEMRDPDERGDSWIAVKNLLPGRHMVALVDQGRIVALKEFSIAPGRTSEVTALHVPREALKTKVRPKGRVVTLEHGRWKGVPDAYVILKFPTLAVTTDADGRFESDTEIEIARLFSTTVDAAGYRPRSMSIDHLKVEALEYYQQTGEIVVPVVRRGARDDQR